MTKDARDNFISANKPRTEKKSPTAKRCPATGQKMWGDLYVSEDFDPEELHVAEAAFVAALSGSCAAGMAFGIAPYLSTIDEVAGQIFAYGAALVFSAVSANMLRYCVEELLNFEMRVKLYVKLFKWTKRNRP